MGNVLSFIYGIYDEQNNSIDCNYFTSSDSLQPFHCATPKLDMNENVFIANEHPNLKHLKKENNHVSGLNTNGIAPPS